MVAQSCTLRGVGKGRREGPSDALPNTIRRYSRLKICATATSHCRLNTHVGGSPTKARGPQVRRRRTPVIWLSCLAPPATAQETDVALPSVSFVLAVLGKIRLGQSPGSVGAFRTSAAIPVQMCCFATAGFRPSRRETPRHERSFRPFV